MGRFRIERRIAAEFLGTALLVSTVVGSGIMAQTLARDPAVALLCNTIPTGAILVVLITVLGPISGAHFNPAVSLVFAMRRDLPRHEAALYAAAQCVGAITGILLTHAMFGQPLLQASATARTGGTQWLAEFVASFGLILVILGGIRFAASSVPWLVGLYITAAYWFTASTSFANPAVALGRALTASYSGIRAADVPAFAMAEIAGAIAGYAVMAWLAAGETLPAETAVAPTAEPARKKPRA